MLHQEQKWDWEIQSRPKFKWGVRDILSYRHLLGSLVRREFLLNYQQTILGPVWILFQPLLTLVTYVLVFGKLIGIPTGENLPPVLFYFSGIVLWNFFNDSFVGTSNTFRDNIQIFSKVYFPRIIMPLSVLFTHFFRLLVQLILLVLMIGYYIIFKDFHVPLSPNLLLVPLAIILTGVISFTLGLFFSVLTAKYRDISNLVYVGIRLLMFVTPVIYPLSAVQEKLRWVVNINPLTPLFELFRLGLLGQGTVAPLQLLYCILFIVLTLFGSLYLFTKQGSKLIDVV
ncbi:ABC transporter permease [Flavisolibacter ginsengisoli]|jgi:lipopolysaccharide transport system permease protein|uniref:Transport permease protein n=1 Tax=Flavisolibacter ginsengisoli DSM 18119 TaxID=1121884 RepID=A0A1M4VJA8_9BACT|nr:ABC transporter permease [Flavisolibacter ginsengisoli]SHE69156.1 lipopolysaccharide transport system permease protein [Flavisolibacter ginsengisoli DSM 18119]